MNGGYLGWNNLTDHPLLNSTDFSIIQYSLRGSDNVNYKCAKIRRRRRRKESLINAIEFKVPRVNLSVTSNVNLISGSI